MCYNKDTEREVDYMKYYHIHGETRYCGTDIDNYIETETELSAQAEREIETDMVNDLTDSYSYLESGWDEDLTEEEEEDFRADCCVIITEITEKQYLIGIGKLEDDGEE